MANPLSNRALPLSGPATDIAPITPDDVNDLPDIAMALYVETGGAISVVTARGQTRTLAVADYAILPVAVRRVRATGTTATGLHALVLA